MKLLFINALFILVKCVFSAKDVGTYFVLDNVSKDKLYLQYI